jgi:Family of unknown function (DUF6188)
MNISALNGRALEEVDGSAASVGQWLFVFGAGCSINIVCDWRVRVGERILLAAGDHEQLFGRQEPVNAIQEANRLLKGKRVADASFGPAGDLTLVFEDGSRLEAFANSCAYESCIVRLPGGKQLVVVGGGDVVEF